MSISSTGSSLTPSSYPNQGLIVMGTGPESGINYTSILNALDEALSAPITLMQSQETPLNNQLSAWQSIGSDIQTLSSSAAALGQPSLFKSYTATSANTSITAAQASSSAIPGTYNVTVSSLATQGYAVAAGVASTSANIGTGTFTVNGNSITINSSDDTLSGLAQAINNSSSALGVTASIVNNGNSSNQYQLVLTANKTGLNATPSVTSVPSGGSTSLSFTSTNGTNAQLKFDGIIIQSQSNTVQNIGIPGVTLSLTGTGSTTVTVGLDTTSIDNAVSSFISAYNKVISDVAGQNTVTTSGSGNNKSAAIGPLGGNTSLANLVNSLSGFIGSVAPGLSGDAGLASTFGITQDSTGSGKLELNTSTLNNMLTSNPSEVQQYLSSLVNGSPTADGASMSGGMTYFLKTYTNPANGVIQFSQQDINDQLTSMNNQISLQQALVQDQMGMYTKQFSSLESYIGQMQTTNTSMSNSIKQMIASGA